MVDVTLPSLGESVTEGIITRWFKRVGEAVERDEPLFEVSTDKVDSEMPSPAAGVLTTILAEEGDTVETGARVAVIDPDGTASESAPASGGESTAPAPPRQSTVRPEAEGAPSGVLLSPVVRRILADGGVEPQTVRGSGPGGTITRRDAERAVALGPTEDVLVPFSAGLRRMGQHMAASALGVPQGFVAIEIDAEKVGELEERGRLGADGVTVTDEALVAWACVRALGQFDRFNASFSDEGLVVHRTIGLGVTRTLDAGGMLVPVVHAAAGLTLGALARRLAGLDERLASRRLNADDLMGGSFTVVRSPSEHALVSQPIIVQPQVATLSMGAVRRVAVPAGHGDPAPFVTGLRVVLGLAFDHRVFEAREAAAFLERVGEILQGIDFESEL